MSSDQKTSKPAAADYTVEEGLKAFEAWYSLNEVTNEIKSFSTLRECWDTAAPKVFLELASLPFVMDSAAHQRFIVWHIGLIAKFISSDDQTDAAAEWVNYLQTKPPKETRPFFKTLKFQVDESDVSHLLSDDKSNKDSVVKSVADMIRDWASDLMFCHITRQANNCRHAYLTANTVMTKLHKDLAESPEAFRYEQVRWIRGNVEPNFKPRKLIIGCLAD